MKTFNQKLKNEKAIFDEMAKEHKGYHKKAMPEVSAYLKQFASETNRTDGQTIYNSELETYIAEKEGVPEAMRDYLGKEVYLAQHDYRAERLEARKQKMISEGWEVLGREVDYRGKIKLLAKVSSDWLSSRVETEAKIITAGNGEAFIVPKGKRSRGWYVYSLDEAYYQPLNK